MMISKRSVELYNTPTAALEKLKIKLMKDKDNTHTKAKTTTTKYKQMISRTHWTHKAMVKEGHPYPVHMIHHQSDASSQR